MIYFACGASALLFWILRHFRHELESKQWTRTLSFLLVDNALKFLRPLMAVTLLYAALSLFVATSDTATIGLLQKYEHMLDNAKGLLGYLKLTPVLSLCVLVVAFVLTLIADVIAVLHPYKHQIERIHSFVDKYHKWIGRVALVVTLLGSFTFFGGTISHERARLEAAIKDTREKGEGFRTLLEEELRTRVAANLMRNLHSLPVSFRPVFAVYEEIDVKEEELLRKKAVSAEYKISSPVTDQLSSDLRARNAKIEALLNDSNIATASREIPTRKYDALISKPKLEALRPEIEKYVMESLRVAKEKLHTPLGSRIGTSLLKIIMSERHIPALQALTTNIPIAGPLLSIFTDSIRKKISILIADAADRIVVRAFAGKALNLNNVVDASASEVAADVLKSVVNGNMIDSGIHHSVAQASLAKIDAAQIDFYNRLDSEKNALREHNRQLIAELRTRHVKKRLGSRPLSINKRPVRPKPLIDFDLFESFLSNDPNRFSIGSLDVDSYESFLRDDSDPLFRRMKNLELQKFLLQKASSAEYNAERKMELAIEQLINAAEGLTDPLVENRMLISIKASISQTSLLERAESLAQVAQQHAGASGIATKDELLDIATRLKTVAPRPPAVDSLRSFRPGPAAKMKTYRPPFRARRR